MPTRPLLSSEEQVHLGPGRPGSGKKRLPNATGSLRAGPKITFSVTEDEKAALETARSELGPSMSWREFLTMLIESRRAVVERPAASFDAAMQERLLLLQRSMEETQRAVAKLEGEFQKSGATRLTQDLIVRQSLDAIVKTTKSIKESTSEQAAGIAKSIDAIASSNLQQSQALLPAINSLAAAAMALSQAKTPAMPSARTQPSSARDIGSTSQRSGSP